MFFIGGLFHIGPIVPAGYDSRAGGKPEQRPALPGYAGRTTRHVL
ncbi:hypothetical protein ATN83_3209 [Raoultella ornithinolytica]|nr:hypothetical protein ATN83_3209 [Raoultella ornithinolytica]KDV94849.1 hypothetical protein AB00_1744 [Raoultella ornithinolytica 2-156-04_S1_C1]KDX14860.1 hypothetical protein AB28_1938 [Raoultella ornithinolytica 2-156-04_S1_C2]